MIKVVSFETRVDSPLYKIVHQNHEDYCKKWGYEYYEVTDFKRFPNQTFPHFYKAFVINEALQNSDYVFYLDMDAVFVNFDKSLEEFKTDAEILMSKDSIGGRCRFDYGWNTGVMMFRHTDRIMKFLSILMTPALIQLFSLLQYHHIIYHFEQNMMEFVFENFDEFEGIVTEIPAKGFNSYIPQRAEVGNAFTSDDLILHLPRNDRRTENVNFEWTQINNLMVLPFNRININEGNTS